MTLVVKDFPIFHRYLASILLKVGLAEGEYSKILETVGGYSVEGYCKCGDPLCSTVNLSSPSLVGKDGAFCNPFSIGWVIINFYLDGEMKVESLADRKEINFPFRQELRDILAGKKLEYDEAYAEQVVGSFMEKLERQEMHKIVV